MEVIEIIELKAKFIQLVNMACLANELITAPNVENIILWPEADAMIRFIGDADDGYESIAVESEKHNTYGYWAPDYDPMFLDCQAEDFETFYNFVVDLVA